MILGGSDFFDGLHLCIIRNKCQNNLHIHDELETKLPRAASDPPEPLPALVNDFVLSHARCDVSLFFRRYQIGKT